MWRSVVAALAISASAVAAEPVEVVVTVPISAMVADAETLLALGPEGGLVMALATGEKRPVELSAEAAVIADVDGSPGDELVTCGKEGLAVLTWPTRTPIAARAGSCSAFAVGRDRDGPVLLSVGAELVVLRLEGEALRQLAVDKAPGGTPIVAAGSDRFAVGTVGGDTITERSAWGTSTIATGGTLGGIAFRDGLWLWSLIDQDALVGQLKEELLTGRGPGQLNVADLNGDGVDDVVVQHADRVGIVRGTSEQMLPWRGPVDAVAIDATACPSIWVASEGVIRGFAGDCVAVVSQPVAAAAPAARQGTQVVSLDGRAVPDLVATVGVPMNARLTDAHGRAFSFGARGGPQGMVVRSDGFIDYTPRAGQEGVYLVDVRMTSGLTVRGAMVRLAVQSSGAAAVAPINGPASAAVSVPGTPQTHVPAPVNSDGVDYRYIARRGGAINTCGLSAGAAAAISRSPQNTWEFVGRGPWTGSVSPSVAMACERDGAGMKFFVRGSTAPLLFYALPGGTLGLHALAGSVGLSTGSEIFRVGGYIRVGIIVAGVGARATFLPFKARGGDVRHGFELDVIGYLPSTPAGGAGLNYLVTL